MGIQTHFDKFHDKIKLGREDDAYSKVRDRDDSIKAEVKTAFSEADYPVVADFIQGSLMTHTGIVPISGDYDIDRALVIDEEKASDNPVAPKEKALDVLEDRGFKNAKIKKPCVTADYASDNVHLDFIVYKRSGNQHYLAVGKKNSDEHNREWSAADPLGLIAWIDDDSDYDKDDANVPHPVSWTHVYATRHGVARTPRALRVACDTPASRGASTGCNVRRTRRRPHAPRQGFERPGRRRLAP